VLANGFGTQTEQALVHQIAASMMINRHRVTAYMAAGQRIDELAERGDLDGAAVWHRIQQVVRLLERGGPDALVN